MNSLRSFLGTCLGISLLCSGSAPVFSSPSMVDSSTSAQARERSLISPAVLSQQQLGFSLLSELTKPELADVVILSPLSITMATHLLYGGTAGSTQQTMAQVLTIPTIPTPELDQYNADLLSDLNAEADSIEIRLSNSLWAQEEVPLETDFVSSRAELYNSPLRSLDFSQLSTVTEINDWVKNETEGKIPQVIDSLDPQDILVIINTLYFRGLWAQQFDPSLTQDLPFYLNDGSQVQHPFMVQQGTFAYYEDAELQMISLPYGKEKQYQFMALLPAPGVSLLRVIADLSPEYWQQLTDQLQHREGRIQLPRLSTSTQIDLIPPLAAIGLGVLFGENADLSGLTPVPAFISAFDHLTVLELDEMGTEAAAATVIRTTRRSSVAVKPFSITLDRPFLFAIQDQHSQSLLFLGVVGNPNP